MDFPVDQDQKWIMDCLTATLDTSRSVRSFAEAALQQASLQTGYGAALTKITVNKGISFGLRQLAAVLLKQFIKQHWQEGEENFVHPVISSEEKGIMRQFLLLSLDDPNRKIRTAISMAIVSIAQYDWPHDYPELLHFLLKLISEKKSLSGVHGALKCLLLLSGELDDIVVPKLLPSLYPHLLAIVSDPHQYEKSLQTKALSIVHSCISVLGSMSGVYKTDTAQLMIPVVNSIMEQFAIILQSPLQSEDPNEWSIRMEVFRCLLQLVQHFPSLVDTQFSVVLTPLWKTFVTSLDAYQTSSVRGIEDSHSGRFDSDGNERSLDAFVMQMFETLLTVIGNSRLQKVIRESIKEVAYYTIGFLQITDEQVHVWSLDANQYVADEDDVTYSCRVSGSLLLEEIANAFGSEGINAIVEAARKHLTESHHAKVSGFADWWRLREASLFALVSISDQLIEVDDSRFSKCNFGYLLEQIIAEDMETDAHKFPFLHSRAFSAISKFSSVISQTVREQLLCAAVQAIDLDVSQPVKVGACQALLQLLPDAKLEIVQPHIMRVLSSLIDLLKQASDETLHLFLETIQVVVKAGHEQSRCIEAVISPVILDVWLHYVSDPFISIDALEVLEAIKNSPGCLHTLVSRIVPSVGLVLGTAKNQPSGLVAGSLDLLTMILKGARLDVVKAVFDCCFNSAIQVLLESDDHGEMQNATECLAVFLASGRHELLSWTGDPSFTMKRLLDAASRLLDPNLECSGSLFVGSYILQLILHFPSEMAFHIREVVAAVIRRLRSCEISGLKSSLILIIARLVHLSSSDVNQFISLLLTLPTDGHKNALSYVMSEWTKVQGEIQGAYQIKVTTIALALLLSTHHEELVKINVEGHLIESNTGITTRSKAKLAPEQWTTVSVPEKIFSLLCDTLVEIQEQVMDDNDDDEDSDWEEVSESNGSVVQNLLYQSTAPSKSGPAVEHLDAMAKVYSECEDNSSEDEFAQADPLNEVKLADFLTKFFVKMSNNDRTLFDHFYRRLTHVQKLAVEKVISK